MNHINSLYKFGGAEILSVEQDEISLLWKIRIATENHSIYVVSREFDKTVGLYGNAPDELICNGLMEFSETINGEELSVYKIMDMFIDRCFSNDAFSKYTEKSLWMSLSYPSYIEIEDILNTYNSHIDWGCGGDDVLSELVKTAVFKDNGNQGKYFSIDSLISSLKSNKISSVFIKDDTKMENFFNNKKFENLPIFKANYKGDNFIGFKYFPHGN